jgi:hypothetical protein
MRIGTECFSQCKFLSDVTFEGSVFIGDGAFSECPLRCVSVPKHVVLNYKFCCAIIEVDAV